MSGWTTIPRWLYENDLPDEQLQEVYLMAAQQKLAGLLEERRALNEQIAQMRALLAEGNEALARYRRRRRGP